VPRDEVVEQFAVSLATIKRWLKQWRERRDLAPKRVPGRPPVKTQPLLAALPERLETHADATLGDQCEWWQERSGVEVSTATMSRALTRLGWTRKKKTLTASERDEEKRAAWREDAVSVLAKDWVFLDETGSNLSFTPTHAWAPRGARADASAPRNRGENKTVLAALTLAGPGPLMRFDGPMTTARFEGYVQFILAPTLRPGQIVVADNLKAHHSDRARAAIEACGAQLWHLPPYSPDYTPIEEAFSKVKQALRRAKARTDDTLRAATWAAFNAITSSDAAGWFAHCGYSLEAQPL
jgi:transposase